MVGPLGGDRQPEQLARQADRIIANIDHFLHFAQALGDDLSGLQRHQTAQIGLAGAQFLAQQADEFTTARGRHFAPHLKGGLRLAQLRLCSGQRGGFDISDDPAVNRRMCGKVRGGTGLVKKGRGHDEAFEDGKSFVARGNRH